jgi:hypothetical protein
MLYVKLPAPVVFVMPAPQSSNVEYRSRCQRVEIAERDTRLRVSRESIRMLVHEAVAMNPRGSMPTSVKVSSAYSLPVSKCGRVLSHDCSMADARFRPSKARRAHPRAARRWSTASCRHAAVPDDVVVAGSSPTMLRLMV